MFRSFLLNSNSIISFELSVLGAKLVYTLYLIRLCGSGNKKLPAIAFIETTRHQFLTGRFGRILMFQKKKKKKTISRQNDGMHEDFEKNSNTGRRCVTGHFYEHS